MKQTFFSLTGQNSAEHFYHKITISDDVQIKRWENYNLVSLLLNIKQHHIKQNKKPT